MTLYAQPRFPMFKAANPQWLRQVGHEGYSDGMYTAVFAVRGTYLLRAELHDATGRVVARHNTPATVADGYRWGIEQHKDYVVKGEAL